MTKRNQNKTKIKICGIKTPDDVKAVNLYRPEYCGFVFWKQSKNRYVHPIEAQVLVSLLRDDIKSVGVFLDEPLEDLIMTVKTSGVDIIQLHGSEDADFIREVQRLTGKPVIKAFRVGNVPELREAEQSPADYIMLDSGAGTGKVFDWDVLRYSARDYFLAGGLNSTNCQTAVQTMHPFALDVSSGVETNGVKDAEKIRTFIRNARKA